MAAVLEYARVFEEPEEVRGKEWKPSAKLKQMLMKYLQAKDKLSKAREVEGKVGTEEMANRD